jgi:hypothetical protein
MAKYAPANNVSAAMAAAVLSPIVLHIFSAYGIMLPDDAANALPGLLAVLVAYIWDLATGENDKPSCQPLPIPAPEQNK